MQVLIVDDSITIRHILRVAMNQIGFDDVLEAADGLEAIALFEKEKPELILLDWHMPKMDGIEFVQKFRETDKTTPIIMLTTEIGREPLLKAVHQGVNDYIQKPFTMEFVNERVRSFIQNAA